MFPPEPPATACVSPQTPATRSHCCISHPRAQLCWASLCPLASTWSPHLLHPGWGPSTGFWSWGSWDPRPIPLQPSCAWQPGLLRLLLILASEKRSFSGPFSPAELDLGPRCPYLVPLPSLHRGSLGGGIVPPFPGCYPSLPQGVTLQFWPSLRINPSGPSSCQTVPGSLGLAHRAPPNPILHPINLPPGQLLAQKTSPYKPPVLWPCPAPKATSAAACVFSHRLSHNRGLPQS